MLHQVGVSFDLYCDARKQKIKKIGCLLLTSVSTFFGHHYAHLQENKGPVTAFNVFFWFCWMWLVAVVGRCLVGCEHYSARQRVTAEGPNKEM